VLSEDPLCDWKEPAPANMRRASEMAFSRMRACLRGEERARCQTFVFGHRPVVDTYSSSERLVMVTSPRRKLKGLPLSLSG
jgi:hypothetical protein